MKKKLLSAAGSTAISLALLLGDPTLSAAAAYVIWITTILALTILLLGGLKDEVLAGMKRQWWISLASSAFSLYAIVATGHSVLAAAYFVTTAAIMLVVHKKEDEQ